MPGPRLGRCRRPRVAALLAALGLVGAGCSGGGGADGGPEGLLRIGLERPQSLDPASARFPAELLLVDQLFDSLTSFNPRTLAARPGLAARWEATPDQKTWLFTLRPDARFSNGRQITSEDVRYSLERVVRLGADSPVATQLDLVVGYRALLDGSAARLAGLTAPEPSLVRFELEYPLAGFPAVVGHPGLGIVPKEAVDARSPAFADQPVGSGPFVIRSRSADVLRLIPAAGTRTELEAIEVQLSRDSLKPYNDFLRGRLDWTAVPAERVAEVERVKGDSASRPYPAAVFYGFNLASPKFADARFREAIVRAVDRPAIVGAAFGGRVRPFSGLVAEGVPGFVAGACGEACRYDPGRSRQLLAEVFGAKPVPEVAIDFDDDPVQQAVANAIAANLGAAGIPTKLRPHAYTDYLGFATSGQQELFRMAWIGANPTPDAFLTPLFFTGQTDNVTGFSAPEVDHLLTAARSEPNEAAREAGYQEAERQILGRYPVIPLAQYETHSVVSDRVSGLVVNAFGTFDATRVSVSR